MKKYNPKIIEKKWQKYWDEHKTFSVTEDPKKQKFYSLIEFPYPSGAGLHVGHTRPFTAMDVISRKKRMEGYNVLYPIGFDAFGLPTENYAIKTGRPPEEVTAENIATFTRQLKASGFSFDWSRVIDTTDPSYYKWTQWLFLQFFKHGLAYKKNQPINWCPKDKIGLANEEVVGGCCERCGTAVEKRNKEQWMLKITEYADKLLEGLKEVDYIPQAKQQQENWIGRSEGAIVDFPLINIQLDGKFENVSIDKVDVFTTRPDTIFGVSYLATSAEHAQAWLEFGWKASEEIKSYIAQVLAERKVANTREEQEKTGIDTGIKARNPVSGEEIPVWITNYVLGDVGTGTIMGVPAHDERDFEFAQKYNLPIKPVVAKHFLEIENPPRADKSTVRRQTIHAIVRRKSDGAILMLRWKANQRPDGKFPYTFIIGGIDPGEDKVVAALRELKEEVGLTKVAFVRELPISVHTEYFAGHKNENRYSEITVLVFEVEGDEQFTIAPEELEKHEPIWVSEKEVEKTINVVDGPYIWRQYRKITPFTDSGIVVNSDFLNDLKTEEAKEKMIAYLEEKELGQRWVQYKLRDWVFSRQRYWGEPIPLVFCEHCKKQGFRYGEELVDDQSEDWSAGWIPLPEDQLPLTLPKVEKYEPTDTGESPLSKIEEWVKVACPKCGGEAKRETDTMPNWAGSSWYFLRYLDPHNDQVFASQENLSYWTPVDWYNGGMEHTVLHLLYSRFWNQFLFDIGLVPTREPYKKRTSHGLILAKGGEKMSKSKGNVVSPDEVVEEYGADTLRTYIMFMGPFDQAVEWDTNGLIGVRRFLDRVWNLQEKIDDAPASVETRLIASLHKTIKKVSEDIDTMRFNTAIASLMELTNELAKSEKIYISHYEELIKLLSPFAPHMCEELHEMFFGKVSIQTQPWPTYDPESIKDQEIALVIQVNGKVRETITVSADISEEEAKKVALGNEKVQKWMEGKVQKKVIYVKGKLVSIVV
jgi:leucyl-tRNA synthetase